MRYALITVLWLVVVGLAGCSLFNKHMSWCVKGPASLAIQGGVGPSTGNVLIKIEEEGQFESTERGETSPCRQPLRDEVDPVPPSVEPVPE